MQQVLIEEYPRIDIAILIVWIDMLAADNEEAARRSAGTFAGEQVRQFHDPERRLGRIIAESLGVDHAVAWDAYLFYDKGSEWTAEHVPAPLDWAHQLDDPWADPDHFAWDRDLVVRLREITARLAGNQLFPQ